MTEKRFYVDKSGDFRDGQTGLVIVDFGYNFNGMECRKIVELLNAQHEEIQRLRKENKELEAFRYAVFKNIEKVHRE